MSKFLSFIQKAVEILNNLVMIHTLLISCFFKKA